MQTGGLYHPSVFEWHTLLGMVTRIGIRTADFHRSFGFTLICLLSSSVFQKPLLFSAFVCGY